MTRADISMLFILLIGACPVLGQVSHVPDPAHAGKLEIKAVLLNDNPFSSRAEGDSQPLVVQPGETLTLELKGIPAPRFHAYPIHSRTAIQDPVGLSTVKTGGGPLKIVWPILESRPQAVDEAALGGKILEFSEPFTWTIEFLVPPETKPGKVDQEIFSKIQVCDDRGCTWGTHRFSLRVEVAGAPVVPSPAVLSSANMPLPPEPLIVGGPAAISENAKGSESKGAVTVIPTLPDPGEVEILGVYPEATIQDPSAFVAFLEKPSPAIKAGQEGLLAFVLQGVFWGAVSLVTPCVFPMIPVTVSIFLKQKSQSWIAPILHALVYCSTIVVVMTLAALAFLSVFVWLSINAVFNMILGCVFIVFSLSLFGMYDIELPGFMTRFTSSREQQGGFVGTFFMALTFSMLSFACVAPFLGGFGGTSSGDGVGLLHKTLGGVAFSATFASPFFILALFPRLMGALPRSGGWMTSVKITMGFVELAAAVKFFRLAEIRNGEALFFTYDASLALTIVVLLGASGYLFQLFSLPSDDPNERQIPVLRMLLGIAVLSMALYLTPGLWKYENGSRVRPQGIVFAWIDAFLLPDSGGHGELPFGGNLVEALRNSKSDGRPVFIDFTGVTCVNCKLNEKNVFPRSEVRRQLERFHLVQLYTDRVIDSLVPAGTTTEEKLRLAEANGAFRDRVFGVNQLPLYAVVRPK